MLRYVHLDGPSSKEPELDTCCIDSILIPHLKTYTDPVNLLYTGYTQPSLNDLHKMIVQHGGGFIQYLDGKTMVTHMYVCYEAW